MPKNSAIRASFVVLLLCAVLPAFGGSIHGRVVDSTGAPLPGVTVEAEASNGRVAAVAVTDGVGAWQLELAAEAFRLKFRLINFATSVRDAMISGDEIIRLDDVTLYLSSSAEVVVTGALTFRNLADLDEAVNDLIGIADASSVGVVTAEQIADRPYQRPGDILEVVPGVIISQHSGEGKANQYYLRGFNIDHGTDFAIAVAGVPVNMPTHAHGQGYADANFVIPEIIGALQYRKGPYSAEAGDFATAGSVNVNYLTELEAPLATVQGGDFGYRRLLGAASPEVAGGRLLVAIEGVLNDGPWEQPDELEKINGIVRYARGNQTGGWNVTAMMYEADWTSTDQVPLRAVESGTLSRFGTLDASDGGETHRYSLSGAWQKSTSGASTSASAYAIDYGLDLFSNFTYFLDDPENGDQFEQFDDRTVVGGSVEHRRFATLFGRQAELLVGGEARRDDIGEVALYRTRERERVSTVRRDAVDQRSAALYGEAAVQLARLVRGTFGIRADAYDFDVRSSLDANSGDADDQLVSPKLALVFGPFRDSELYVNAGWGFHSNDGRGTVMTIDPSTGEAADPVDPLVRTKGAELGLRTRAASRYHAAVALWGLDIDSELLFVGDAGTTEPSRPSRRYGVELEGYVNLARNLTLDADLAWSHARFRDEDPAGDRIPGAVEGVASIGLHWEVTKEIDAGVRYRYFGPRPLVEDDSQRSNASNLVSMQLGWMPLRWLRLEAEVFNLFETEASDIDYYYASRLPVEPDEGVDDVHFHPVEPRSVRLGFRATF